MRAVGLLMPLPGGPIRVANLNAPRRIMGQAEGPNRLLDVRISAIVSRGALLRQPFPEGWVPAPAETWSSSERSLIEAAGMAPSPEELGDVRAVDALYGLMDATGKSSTRQKARRFYLGLCGGFPGGYSHEFFCTGAERATRFHIGEQDAFGFFGIPESGKWGDSRTAALNAAVFLRALDGYPFPKPVGMMPGFFFQAARKELREAVKKGRATPEGARAIVTLLVLRHYNEAVAGIQDQIEKDERWERRTVLIKTVILTTAGLVLAGVGAAAVAGAISAASKTMDEEERRKAAADLEKAAKQFQAEDAAFAGEIRAVCGEVDPAACAREQARAMTDEERKAAADAKAAADRLAATTPERLRAAEERALAGGPSLTTLAVGGGIAVGATAILVALLR